MSQGQHSASAITGTFMDEFGGSLVNLILGGMLLWVGQTTFEHNGELAGLHQQLDAITKRHELLSERYDRVVDSINDRTRSRFTSEDGEKLLQRIESVEHTHSTLKDRIQERLGELRVQVSAIEIQLNTLGVRTTPVSRQRVTPEYEAIHNELLRLRSDLDRLTGSVNHEHAGFAPSRPRVAPAKIPTLPVGSRQGDRVWR